MALPYQDASWWVLAKLDSALVSAAEGTSAAWYQRDPKLFRSLGWRSLVAHRRLRRQLVPAGHGVPGRGGRLQLTRAVEGDLRGVGGRLARWAVSSVPTGQQGRSSRPGGPGGTGEGAESAAGADRARAGAVTAAPPGRRPPVAVRYAPVILAAAAMAVLGVWGLARDSSMGNDEVATRWAALLSLHQLAHLLRHVDAVHGLYYLLMHGWMAVGTSPAVMRIPSVIAMVVAVALTVIIGRRLTGSGWAGLFAGLIVAFTPTISYYAQTARSYALVFACVVGSTLALLHALAAEAPAAGPGARDASPGGAADAAGRTRFPAGRWLGYAVLLVAGGYLNELSLLVVAAHAVTVLLARYGRRALVHWAGTAAVSVILVLPLAALSAREDAAVAWIPRPGLWSLRILFHDYFGATTAIAVLLFCCAVAAVLPPLHRGRRAPGPAWWSQGGLSLPSVAAPLLVVPGVLLILESLVARPLYVDRYVLYGEAGAALLAGAGAARIGRWLAGGPAGGCCSGSPAWPSACSPWFCSWRRSTGSAPRRAGCSTSAAPPAMWPRTPARAMVSCSSATSTARPGSVTRRTTGTSATSRWRSRPPRPGTSRAGTSRSPPSSPSWSATSGSGWSAGPRSRTSAPARSAPRTPCCAATSPCPRNATSRASSSRSGCAADHAVPPPPGGRRPGWLRMPRRSS